MCVIFFYVNSKPSAGGYKLILASNRDEFYARDTQAAAKWPKAQHVYGGIDLEPGREGGTWLAVSGRDGVIKVGALLNLTGEPKPRHAEVTTANDTTTTNHTHNLLLGRGMIVSDYVTSNASDHTIEAYNERLVKDCKKYSAFNFVSIQISSSDAPAAITHCSNVPPTLTRYSEGQCYGFGNSLPEVPFAKVQYGQQRFEQIVNDYNAKLNEQISTPAEAQSVLVGELLALLKCKQKFWPDAELQRRAPNWGVQLSALNVDVPHEQYGSRTHSVILVDANNKMFFHEETMLELDQAGKWAKTCIEEQFC